ncbi:hypothetical protein AVEN_88550-1 [Araneus ventricosus]|uniref:Uncharacterized protein n=1 Tax=Araneus ventricosus TaxID=182803 RepID=A0A4Y2R8D8_ARAVE|nr:hypothetical protein AVEN_88550-1 [Araneus ventricosus]
MKLHFLGLPAISQNRNVREHLVLTFFSGTPPLWSVPAEVSSSSSDSGSKWRGPPQNVMQLCCIPSLGSLRSGSNFQCSSVLRRSCRFRRVL